MLKNHQITEFLQRHDATTQLGVHPQYDRRLHLVASRNDAGEALYDRESFVLRRDTTNTTEIQTEAPLARTPSAKKQAKIVPSLISRPFISRAPLATSRSFRTLAMLFVSSDFGDVLVEFGHRFDFECFHLKKKEVSYLSNNRFTYLFVCVRISATRATPRGGSDAA